MPSSTHIYNGEHILFIKYEHNAKDVGAGPVSAWAKEKYLKNNRSIMQKQGRTQGPPLQICEEK